MRYLRLLARDYVWAASDRLCARPRTFAFGNWLGEIGWQLGTDRHGRPLR